PQLHGELAGRRRLRFAGNGSRAAGRTPGAHRRARTDAHRADPAAGGETALLRAGRQGVPDGLAVFKVCEATLARGLLRWRAERGVRFVRTGVRRHEAGLRGCREAWCSHVLPDHGVRDGRAADPALPGDGVQVRLARGQSAPGPRRFAGLDDRRGPRVAVHGLPVRGFCADQAARGADRPHAVGAAVGYRSVRCFLRCAEGDPVVPPPSAWKADHRPGHGIGGIAGLMTAKPMAAHGAAAPSSSRSVLGAYLALTKPRIIELLLVTTIPAMFLAERGIPSPWLVLVTLVGGTMAAASANVLNCVADSDIDAVMERTKKRPLARY